MERPTSAKFNAQICEEACEWFVEFRTREPDESARKAFHDWLQESPKHIDTYLQIAAIWSESAALDRKGKWTLDALVTQAAGDPGNLVLLESHSRVPSEEREGTRIRTPSKASSTMRFILAAASVLVAVAGLSVWFVTQRNTYAAAIGEQRSIALPDGSNVNLNSRSRIRVRYSERERVVELQEGQALFEVAKNPSRPFIVTSGKTRVRAVGTRFDVYRKTSGTTVTVIEGRVAVLPEGFHPQPFFATAEKEDAADPSQSIKREPSRHPLSLEEKEGFAKHDGEASRAGTPSPIVRQRHSLRDGNGGTGASYTLSPGEGGSTEDEGPFSSPPDRRRASGAALEVFLDAGQQLRVASNVVPRPIPADIARATSWTQRQLVFDSTPLVEVAEEFNRYNTQQIVIRDPALNRFQIGGVFSSTDPASLLRFLHARPDIRVIETRAQIIITRE